LVNFREQLNRIDVFLIFYLVIYMAYALFSFQKGGVEGTPIFSLLFYPLLFMLSTVFLFLIITQVEFGAAVKVPFTGSLYSSGFQALIGLIIILVLNIKNFLGFLGVELSLAPLSSVQAFAATANPFTTQFMQVVVGASVVEEYAFGIFFFLFFAGTAYFVARQYFGTKLSLQQAYLIAAPFVVFAFAFVHKLSPSYTSFSQYMFAALFRTGLLYLYIAMGFTILAVFIHFGFNLAVLATTTGGAIYAGMFSGVGLLFFVVMLLHALIGVRGVYLASKGKISWGELLRG